MTAAPPSDSLAATVARAVEGQFALERELGRGGMGVVYLARDLKLDRQVALKVLPAALVADPVTRERFLREARTAGRLSHPHIVPVHRADEVEGLAFFAMTYVEGESLADRVRDRGPLPVSEAVRILREVAWALAYAHARGVVHRDVKPENILLERGSGRALVTDFGIAHRLEGLSPDATRLTHDGSVLGTLHYLSPEQAMGAPLDGRSDLYALGVVAWHVLSARLPFDDARGPAVLVAHVTRPAPPLRQIAPEVPAAVAAVVDRCLAKEPGERWATGEALADALQAALEDSAPAADAAPRLPAGVPQVLSAAQATALWQRAAQLQADALRQVEGRRDLLPVEPDGGSPDGATPAPGTGYRLTDVAAAAREAGISSQYVALALAELPRGAAPGDVAVAARPVGDRTAARYLGTSEHGLTVTHVVRAAPGRTLRSLGAALRHSPFDLQLRETIGPHPLDGGVLVFDLPVQLGTTGQIVGFSTSYWTATALQLEARQVQITLRPLPGDAQATELTMSCDLRPGERRNVRVARGLAGTVGGVSATLLGALLAKGPAVALSVAVLGPATVAGLGAAGLAVVGYRRLYPSVMRKAREEMLGALRAISSALQAEAVFGPEPGTGPVTSPGAELRPPDDRPGTRVR